MQIECTHHIDASEPDEDGFYDYYYEYDLYHFRAESLCLVARSYSDTPTQAHFLRIEKQGKGRLLTPEDLKQALLQQAMDYLRDQSKQELTWLNGERGAYAPF